ncbi:MAG TPA: S53 family peptidase [Acidimicrobiales bacterium]|nr:S53 family peptidase [Acidimicrobiales bacterium]
MKSAPSPTASGGGARRCPGERVAHGRRRLLLVLWLAWAPAAVTLPGSPAGAAGAPPGPRVTLPGTPPVLPRGSVVDGTVAPDQVLHAEVVLALPDPGAVEAAVAAVSTPGSPQYRHFLGPGEFAARFGPGPAQVAAARAWLASAGLQTGSLVGGTTLPVEGPAAAMSAAFGTPLERVRVAGAAPAVVNAAAPSVPAALAGTVASVIGLDTLPVWKTHLVLGTPGAAAWQTGGASLVPGPAAVADGGRGPAGATLRDAVSGAPSLAGHLASTPTGPGTCPAAGTAVAAGALTQPAVAAAYGMGPLYAQGRVGAGVTIALFELESYDPADVAAFQACEGLGSPVADRLVDGGPLPGPGGLAGSGEAALDIENAMAFAPGAALLVYEGPNNGAQGPYDVYQRIADDDAAQVVSTSWGICEPQMAQVGLSPAAEQQLFEQMALQGQTVVAASGDTGSEDCPGSGALAVDDPGSQPGVVDVGGTTLTIGPGGSGSEVVWNGHGGAGGGGMSANWDMPSWQRQAGRGTVNPFSSEGTCPQPPGGSLCREVPDVAASADPAHGYTVLHDGTWVSAGGTSAAAPLWAALMALAVQGCAAPLGSADPALYALGGAGSPALRDVVAGDNDFTGTNQGRYPAAPGYDLASGWGSPDGALLVPQLQPAGGCPSVSGLSARTGPLGRAATVTVYGDGLGGAVAVHAGAAGQATIVSSSPNSVTVTLPAVSVPEAVDITVTTPEGTSAAVPWDRYAFGALHDDRGYWEVAADGGVFAFGDAGFYGSMGGQPLAAPVVGIAPTSSDRGYWEVAADGGVFAFGDAGFFGSMGGQPLAAPVVGIAPTLDSRGYVLAAADGGVFAFGDAQFYGSMGGQHLAAAVRGAAVTFDDGGYWEVAADGGVFAFGDAGFFGSMGGRPLAAPVVGFSPS